MSDEKTGKAWIDEARELREQILKRRGGKLVEPSTAEIISRLREGLCSECGRDVLAIGEQAENRKKGATEMAQEQKKPSRKAKVSRPKRVKRGSWLEEAIKFQEKVLARRGGELLPDSSNWIRESRETEW
ncbi:MAG: hypothetical protein HYX78_12105 [Armatimonadetes bacterium]|nr:hypothetical protein [Armatimonadota bacterium]